jgi:4-hydroxybenzoate polyprenyltransferase
VQASSPPNLFRTLLILGRVSNLPTVWSNCLAAWLLNNGAAWSNFYVLIAGATMLYLGGMFLNDAFDAEFDKQHRTGRPIPAGRISRRAVWRMGGTLLVLGWLGLVLLGRETAFGGLLLVAAIVFYDAVHKRTAFAPLLMAGCRFLLYLVAAAATLRPVSTPVVAQAFGLAAYITGLSYLARVESVGSLAGRWPLALLFAPCVIAVGLTTARAEVAWLAMGIFVAWVCWCLRGVLRPASRNIGRTVAGLLAGIVLVDWLAIPQPSDQIALGFAGWFALALVLQRKVPAT